MRVLGYGGLHNSADFTREWFPDLDERSARIVQGLDSAAALVIDGTIVAAAAEERFTGVKTTGCFPRQAAAFCLAAGGLAAADLDAVAHGFAYQPSALHEQNTFTRERFERVYDPAVQLGWLRMLDPEVDWAAKFEAVPHHLAHAASAFYPSGFDEALVLVVDGMGEWESLSVGSADRSGIRLRHRISASHSLGVLYGIGTLYLGFQVNLDEYKVMGLAANGDRRRLGSALRRYVRLADDGGFTIPVLAADATPHEKATHEGVLAEFDRAFGPRRQPGAPLESHHVDFAAALQDTLEQTLLHVLEHHREVTGARSLVVAGGVALNCAANGLVSRSRLFDRIFVQPASGDDGTAVGAALEVERRSAPQRRPTAMTMPYWGPEYPASAVAEALDLGSGGWEHTSYSDDASLVAEVADLLAAGRTVAWFRGRMEFGPRALGNRSIFADPRDAAMREHLNRVVKRREEFRPFAPIVAAEVAADYFDVVADDLQRYRHMLHAVPVLPAGRAVLPAAVHVDGTARIQVLDRRDNPAVWALLQAFGERTGVPVLINTSFNLRGQPIVRDPVTAVETFARSELDALAIADQLLVRAGRLADEASSRRW